jgi:DNA-3-methyladenine glycosylase II
MLWDIILLSIPTKIPDIIYPLNFLHWLGMNNSQSTPHNELSPKVIAEAEKHLSKQDKKLAKLIRDIGPCAIDVSDRSKFEMLISTIISQQLSNAASTTIFNRVIECTGGRTNLAKRLKDLSFEEIRACGVSSTKAKSILQIAELVSTKQLDLESLGETDDEAVYRTLTSITGVGPWTVQMFLMFALRRTDIFSPGDAALRRGLMKLYGMQDKPTETDMLVIAEKWSPYRTVASWYLWRI